MILMTLKRVPPPVGTWMFLLIAVRRSAENMIKFSSTPGTPAVRMTQSSPKGWKSQVMDSGGMEGGEEPKKLSKLVVSKLEELTVTVSPCTAATTPVPVGRVVLKGSGGDRGIM